MEITSRICSGPYRLISRATPIVIALLLIGMVPHPARAQAAGQSGQSWSNPFGIEVIATPYLWMPWTSVGVHPNVARLPGLPNASSTVDPGTLISHLTWVPFMGAVEFRKDEYGLLLDYIHAPVKAGINTPAIVFGSAGVGLTMDTGTAIFMYRVLSDPVQYVDIGAGIRAWGLGGSLSLNEGLLPAVTVSRGAAWADGLAAVRYHRDLGDGFGATANGDIGGGGANLDWQAVATLDYTLRPGVDLHAGFRSMNFNASGMFADFHTHMYGPILSASFHFGP